MRNASLCGSLVLTLLVGGCGPEPVAPGPSSETSVDVLAIDTTVKPCDDFYRFACGGWVKRNPLTATAAREARSFEAYRTQYSQLKAILDENLAGQVHADDPEGPLVAQFYRSCLDAPTSRSAHSEFAALLKIVDSVATREDLPLATARLREVNAEVFFSFYVSVDRSDATRNLATADQGGLTLPDRQHYLSPSFAELRTRYLAHIQQLTQKLVPPLSVSASAVLRIETALAQASLDPAARRDPAATFRPVARTVFLSSSPSFGWDGFWQESGMGGLQTLNVTVPGYFEALEALLLRESVADLKSYLRWRLIEAQAGALDQSILNDEFDFHVRGFTGQQSPPPPEWRCYLAATRSLADALARPYVARHFGETSRTSALKLLESVQAAFRKRLEVATWLDAPTRTEALAKLAKLSQGVGFPDAFRSYASVGITASYLENRNRLSREAYRLNAARLTQTVERNRWYMPAIEVNAYYSPQLNQMVFPAGILQSPFFQVSSSIASNFGGIGTVMGHELTHGFDDAGRQFDGLGTLRDWWNPTVKASFVNRSQCLVDQFSGYQPLPGEAVNGQLTLGENLADLGGLRVAWEAFQARLTAGEVSHSKLPGYNARQEFFLSFAQLWCENERPELTRELLLSDPHSPNPFRVNGPLSNLPAFAEAFECAADSSMVRAPACEVW